MAFLASDNTSGMNLEILESLKRANEGHARSYGGDELTEKLTFRLREVFEHETLLAFPVFNGSAANCLALASMMRSYEAVVCHTQSHIERDECGMPEFFTRGKTLTVQGDNGKILPEQVALLVQNAKASGVHHVRPKVISITQSTETGTTYTPEEIRKLSEFAGTHDMFMHMDGARFANAVAATGCKPAEISWKSGVDVLSFGGTKNGAILAEAIIFFNTTLATDFGYRRKQAGQLASKQRFISAQLLALLEHDLWLKNAAQANAMAKKLAEGLLKIPQVKILFQTEANSVFAYLPKIFAEKLLAKGHYFYDWPILGNNIYRLVTSFNTATSEIEHFIADCREFSR